jgi:hypothetical protein
MSVREFLEALSDAIRGHKSILEHGRILGRNISETISFITESAIEKNPKGC